MSVPLPIGVVGVGSVGRHHLRHLCRDRDARVVGLYDQSPNRAQQVADTFGVRAFDDLDSLLAQVEAVTIAVPTGAHATVGCQALEHHVAVLIEKPLAGTLLDADLLLSTATTHHTFLQVGHVERFNRAVRAVIPYLQDPLYLESSRLAPFQPRGIDVPVILDLMIHDLDLMLYLTGARGVSLVRGNGMAILSPLIDVANAWVEFDHGTVAFASTSRLSHSRVRKLRIWQPSGYFSLDLAEGSAHFTRRPSGACEGDTGWLGQAVLEQIHLEVRQEDALRLELESFVCAVRGGSDPVVTGEEGRAALDLALQVSDAIAAARTA